LLRGHAHGIARRAPARGSVARTAAPGTDDLYHAAPGPGDATVCSLMVEDGETASAAGGSAVVTAATASAAGAEPEAVAGRRERPWWAMPAVVVAALAVCAGAVWGVRGLFGNPIKGTDAAGVTTIQGSWEPITCGSPCIGNVQDGGRSVTVILADGCPQPAREAGVTVRGRLDTSQGNGTYRALGCASP
ncbi:MAG TPA: hypothetical protein VFO60_08485, partial [Candidatus Dormibacteraeota bacterium]|nr:hypothetical protein [Candidatus Dormibacteraeota bacterium]